MLIKFSKYGQYWDPGNELDAIDMNLHMYHFKALCSSSPATCDNFQRLERLLSLEGSSAKREHLAFAIPLPFSP